MTAIDSFTLQNGTNMPKVGLGVYKMNDDQEVINAVLSALDLGYRHIDTASFYENEKGVGDALKRSKVEREDIFVTTKVWNDEQGYEETLDAFERSMEKLQLDYLDLYLIHWPVPGKYTETWKALEKLYRDGRVKAIGVCNFMEHHLDELMNTAEIKPMVNQVELHPRIYQKELMEYCKEHKIQVEAWAPIGRGKYFDAPVLKKLSDKYGKSPAQIILRWHLEHDVVVIPKSSNKSRQEENADLFDFELKAEEVEEINALHTGERIGKHPDEFDYEA
ncbi:aldo/keto reductase [Halobacillus litoralis]|uniref:aldo/keto reductase n=1 Tax=Halobacillus litoralis TaxID=45668 RepID=UPI001CD6C6D6|nr:aldo/keto reductase [Halobacillus litoralis]MCA0969749.1 aldo/keto reductase [Halobacillus litoralis]